MEIKSGGFKSGMVLGGTDSMQVKWENLGLRPKPAQPSQPQSKHPTSKLPPCPTTEAMHWCLAEHAPRIKYLCLHGFLAVNRFNNGIPRCPQQDPDQRPDVVLVLRE